MNSDTLCVQTCSCRYYLVLVPRNRTAALYAVHRQEIDALLRAVCHHVKADMLSMDSRPDYIGVWLCIPPQHRALDTVQRLTARSSQELSLHYPPWAPLLSDRGFWADGCLLYTYNPGRRIVERFVEKVQQLDKIKDQI